MTLSERKREMRLLRREHGLKRRLLFVGVSLASSLVAPSECFSSMFSSVLMQQLRDSKDSTSHQFHDSKTKRRKADSKQDASSKGKSRNKASKSSLLSRSPLKTRLSKEEERRFLHTCQIYNTAKNTASGIKSLRGNVRHLTLKDVDEAMKIGPAARDALIQHNMGLVYFVVSKYYSYGNDGKGGTLTSLSYDDLVQEGVIGLATAIEKYDVAIAEEAKSSFGTYALFWIKAKVLRALSSREELIRVPEHVTYSISRIQSASQRLGLDLDLTDLNRSGILSISDPSHERALAVEAGLNVNQVREALRVARRRQLGGYVSFEPWMQSTSSSTLSDENVIMNQGYQELARDDLKKNIAQFLKPKELEALSLRYGLSSELPMTGRDYELEAEIDLFGESTRETVKKEAANTKTIKQGRWGEAMSFKEIGKRMAVSTEYGRQLCAAALEKLRSAAEDGELQLDYVGI